ncbi:MAG: hypothetical protein E7255_01580 [Lachnospiraceae bacterium]|nr:hypothetical protein [Lachnospiraceae bacterium]
MVGLRPGKATIYQYTYNNNIIKYNITVKRIELDSITSFFGLSKEDEFISSGRNYYAKKTDQTAQDILKILKLDQCNSDKERIAEVSKYLHNTITMSYYSYETYIDSAAYGALVKKLTGTGINQGSHLLIKNLGFNTTLLPALLDLCVSKILLEGVYYCYDLYSDRGNLFLGSEYLDYIYAGEGTYTNEAGETLQGSLYYDENGIISDEEIENYTFDVNNEFLTTNGEFLKTQDEKLLYLSTARKSHLPAWLIDCDRPQQFIQKGKSVKLPKDRLSTNVSSSDESIVKIENNKMVGVKEGIAIVYRYDDKFCDAFYVVVDKKPESQKLTLNYKKDGKNYLSYKTSDISSHRFIISSDETLRGDIWDETSLYILEPALNGGKLQTTYKNGYLKVYVIDANGKKEKIFDDTDYKFDY